MVGETKLDSQFLASHFIITDNILFCRQKSMWSRLDFLYKQGYSLYGASCFYSIIYDNIRLLDDFKIFRDKEHLKEIGNSLVSVILSKQQFVTWVPIIPLLMIKSKI